MKYLKMFLLAVLAGVAISVGCILYLSIDNKIVGAILFTVGLYAVCAHGFNLYTGKVGYLVDKSPSYLVELLIIWLGNFSGTWLIAKVILLTRINTISQNASALCDIKLNDSLLSLFILGIMCGVLMYIAVEGYRILKNPVILFACIAAFILCGFEHCIADIFYFSVASMWSLRTLVIILVITLGNSVGSCIIALIKKMPEKLKEHKSK
jgi:formate/nitrite transporter FocA (FNT family)